MQYTPYTFAAADFVGVSIACFLTLVVFLCIGWVFCQLYPNPVEYSGFRESDIDATFEDAPDLSETGIACEIAKMAPGTQLVEVDTAGMLTPPQHVFVHEYVWTGSEIKFVRRVPLHEFDFIIPGSAAIHAASHPEAMQAREDFLLRHNRFDPLPVETRPNEAGGVTSQRYRERL